MISKKSLVPVVDKYIILTITAPNDNAKSISVQCVWGGADYLTCPHQDFLYSGDTAYDKSQRAAYNLVVCSCIMYHCIGTPRYKTYSSHEMLFFCLQKTSFPSEPKYKNLSFVAKYITCLNKFIKQLLIEIPKKEPKFNACSKVTNIFYFLFTFIKKVL